MLDALPDVTLLSRLETGTGELTPQLTPWFPAWESNPGYNGESAESYNMTKWKEKKN